MLNGIGKTETLKMVHVYKLCFQQNLECTIQYENLLFYSNNTKMEQITQVLCHQK